MHKTVHVPCSHEWTHTLCTLGRALIGYGVGKDVSERRRRGKSRGWGVDVLCTLCKGERGKGFEGGGGK